MRVDEMNPGAQMFFRFLRSECTACGGEDLSWIMALDVPGELREPHWPREQREQMRTLIKSGMAREDVWVWLCGGCGELGAVEGGRW